MKKKLLIILLYVLASIFIIYLIYIVQKITSSIQSDNKTDNSSVMVINNMDLDRNLSSDTRVKIKAQKALITSNKKELYLDNCSIEYTSKKMTLYATAGKCEYEEDKVITIRDNITGTVNDIRITGGDKSILVFYIDKGYGIIKGGVTITHNESSIKADKAEIFKDNRTLNFYDNVHAVYYK